MAAAQRIDWQAIKARWNTEAEVFHLAVLPKGAAQLFLAICDRLQWEATYRIEGYDFADWDELQRIVDLGIAGLTDTMRLSDLIAHVDEVEDLLRQISALSGCCGELSHPFADLLTDPWQQGDPVPENIVDAGFASSTSDQAGYTDYKCLIANVAVQDLVEKINRMAQLIDESNWVVGGVAAIASILTFVVALPAAATVLTAMALGLVAGAGTAAGVWAWLNGVGKATAESTALALDAVYDELVCAIYQADGPDAATSAVAAVISDTTNAAASLALTPVISMVIHALYAGRYDQTDTAEALANAGFTLAQHDCNCAAEEMLGSTGIYMRLDACEATAAIPLYHEGAVAGDPVFITGASSMGALNSIVTPRTYAYAYTPALAGVEADVEVGEGTICPDQDYEVCPGQSFRLRMASGSGSTRTASFTLTVLEVYDHSASAWVPVHSVNKLAGDAAIGVDGNQIIMPTASFDPFGSKTIDFSVNV